MDTVTTLPAPHDGWTVEDLDHLPDDGLRYELVDGALLVSPPATNIHGYIVLELAVRLRAALSDPWRVVTGGGIRFDARNYRSADLMVVQKSALAGTWHPRRTCCSQWRS